MDKKLAKQDTKTDSASFEELMAKLKPKQRAFVTEYLDCRSAIEAYKRAGYSAKGRNAKANAYRMMENDGISAAIEAALKKLDADAIVTVAEADRQLGCIVMGDIRKLFTPDGALKPPNEWSDDIAAAIGGLEVKEELRGRGKKRKAVGYLKKVKCLDKISAIAEFYKRHNAVKHPIPGRSAENPIHVSSTHSLAPDAIRSFIGDLRRAGIGGEGVEGISSDSEASATVE